MGIKTKISWCDSSINPIMGCTGCALRKDHCYAAALCARYAGCKGWPKSFDEPEFFPGRLEKAIRWSDLTGKDRPDEPWLNGLPRHIFVNDLSDGFCPDVDAYSWLLPHLDPMESAPHTWLLLTKWPNRMQEFFAGVGGAPDNFYLGVSVENQATADERIPWLLQTPAAVRFVSVEPMLGPVNLTSYLPPYHNAAELSVRNGRWGTCVECPVDKMGHIFPEKCKHTLRYDHNLAAEPWLNWVICGGESGPGARPMHPDWARSPHDQCQAAGVPFFFKQWGAWLPLSQRTDQRQVTQARETKVHLVPGGKSVQYEYCYRVGKKRAGRLLDGRVWDQFPVSAKVIT